MCMCLLPCQVSQLYDVVQKWDAMSTSIPQVVQRLVAVKELHEQGNTGTGTGLMCPKLVFCFYIKSRLKPYSKRITLLIDII